MSPMPPSRAPKIAPATRRIAESRSQEDQTRLDAAMRGFITDFGPEAATWMEACLHCGQCAEACQFYVETGDPKYTPIWKIEPFKQAYNRQMGPFAPLFRMFGLTPSVSLGQLEHWQELLYDSCNMCGRCTMVCPAGIDIADLVEKARHGMFDAGLVPPDYLGALAGKERETGSPFGIAPNAMRDSLLEIGEKHGVEMHVDEPRAEVVPAVSSIDLKMYPDSIAATAKVLNHIGVRWSFMTKGFDADNVSLTAGDREGQKIVTEAIVAAATDCGAQVLIMPECGHSYTEMRWEAANTVGHALPFRVLHMSEYLAEALEAGQLHLRPVPKDGQGHGVTFHDPCQVSRRSGRSDAPRRIMQALGLDLHELADHGPDSWCCGGGGGVALIGRAKTLRNHAFDIKKRQVAETGADTVYVTCTGCRQTFEHGFKDAGAETGVGSLLDLVAEQLDEKEKTS
ncbi:4Fe-4S dicluster domain-containing protein [Pseudooceanicola sp. CBS1P-1]|uniref:4Fe-4S dicluster domain-containing protein n=1 Tax=Pseudooceanicola albus TaxID=2692189 RepID=A0A6L7GBZ3_9RHOB|nr:MULTISPECIES: (Fe-S)-binding protein [Pseudooceanicola]MBT9386263.1 4Fe-4S dicluster domain-containing protein [Pseudooceanicola endophyticus]MXN20313.1 4Fe-4S dicluster domain-containing protein [Pseudooceanicola albus]